MLTVEEENTPADRRETEGSTMTEKRIDLREMDEQELFCVLTGSYGIMPQTWLREILNAYRATYGRLAGLTEMVRTMTAGPVKKAG